MLDQKRRFDRFGLKNPRGLPRDAAGNGVCCFFVAELDALLEYFEPGLAGDEAAFKSKLVAFT
eukprot:m.251331 g.251331  ORF g.251331 m.251331 type:complete len:63 (-) comp16148_c0_seq7:1922-2110(-)